MKAGVGCTRGGVSVRTQSKQCAKDREIATVQFSTPATNRPKTESEMPQPFSAAEHSGRKKCSSAAREQFSNPQTWQTVWMGPAADLLCSTEPPAKSFRAWLSETHVDVARCGHISCRNVRTYRTLCRLPFCFRQRGTHAQNTTPPPPPESARGPTSRRNSAKLPKTKISGVELIEERHAKWNDNYTANTA